jgi:CHAT domain-containing protein/Tfp pilus assembly protein PilF
MLALLYDTQDNFEQAEVLYKRSLDIRERALGPDHPDVAQSLEMLALFYTGQGTYVSQARYAQAEPLFKRALAIWDKALAQDHPDVAESLVIVARLYFNQGQYAQAEPLFKRSLAIREKALGLDHQDVSQSLSELALLYRIQYQYAKAEPLFKRALAIREKSAGPDDPAVATSLNNLAQLYDTQGQYSQAESLFKRALAIEEKSLGPDHPNVASTLNNLAALYTRQKKYAQAEPLFKRSLAIDEKARGSDHPQVATSLNNLAKLYYYQGHYAQAEPLYTQSLAIWEKALGPDHPHVATSLNNLVLLYGIQGQHARALPLARRVSEIYKKRIVADGTGDVAVSEAAQNRSGFRNHLWLLFQNPDKEAEDKIANEAFQVVQLEQASGTASAIAKMASRFASNDDALAGLIKRKQDASDRRTKMESQLVKTAGKPPQNRNLAAEQRLRDAIALTTKEHEAIDIELNNRFPEYQELARPEPASLEHIQSLLHPEEAILVFSLPDKKGGFMWVVGKSVNHFFHLKFDGEKSAAMIKSIRSEMEFDGTGRTSRVSVGVLHGLYQSLIAPALPYLAGVRHIMVVPAGPLQSLPFGMLVASPPPEIKSDEDYRKVDWLAKYYAISVLPSVSSIQAFRQFAKLGSSQEPFAGFGDPLIGGSDGPTRGKRSKLDVSTVFRNVTTNTNTPGSASATEIADVETIRSAPRLPETADELRAMAKVLKSDQNSLWLQENATETKIKHLDLSKYRTIAFATHGVMAGEVKGIGEPGLILTPPQQGSLEDDGYLSAGEIARLKLNADWVVLSACNTAAADGTPGAEGLSGLAKAFFYAGARSLLVSHWPVASEATVPLTTGMLKEYEANPGQGKAEAHRKAMMALMATPDHPEYAHPIFWAPFVVVGEGGAGMPGSAALLSR